MRRWIFVGIILLLSINTINASTYSCGVDGFGTYTDYFYKGSDFPPSPPNHYTCGKNGSIDFIVNCSSNYNITTIFHISNSYYYNSSLGEWKVGGTVYCSAQYDSGSIRWTSPHIGDGETYIYEDTYLTYISDDPYHVYLPDHGCSYGHDYDGYITLIVSENILNNYTISGNISCADWVKLLIKNNDDTYSQVDYNDTSYYEFKIFDTQQYKLVFSDGHEYEFTCNGTDITYNYDACSYCAINIYDNCANLLNGAYTVIYDMDKNMDVVYSGYDNPINLTNIDVNNTDELRIIWSTWMGGMKKTCYAQFDHDINLFDPLVYWNMDIYVYDNESNPIWNATVDFNQDCVINGYPARNKYTDYSGLVEFTQCENDGANLVVSKDGYQTLSTTISGGWYDVYTSTYEVSVTLQTSDSGNDSTWDVINNSINDTNATEEPEDIPYYNGTPIDVHLYFKNMDGDYVTKINDSDDYVRCYYSVNVPDSVSMTLSFQSSLSGYWFTDIYTYSYTIDNNSYGYMNLSNDNFSDPDYIYRAYIRDPSYPEYDRYVYLSVVNQTSESETHYENLSGYCMFMHTNDNGSIDYREGIVCYALVMSDNASLRMVSLELYDNSTLIDYVNLTDSSFDEDDIYAWELGYTYTLGHNYSLVLKASDGSILDCDNVIAYNLVGNKLTIKVTDSFNHDLDHVYVYVEHYGSINTGYLNYGTFEGLPNGETRYKATKSGYRSGVWKTVNLTDENEIVTYQLIQEAPTGSIASVRMSDNDVKDLYYPFMYFLFIIILIGALMNVIN